METLTVRIEGMSCAHCEQRVARALREVPGVVAAEVSLARAEARVTFDPGRVDVADLARAVEEAGYTLVAP